MTVTSTKFCLFPVKYLQKNIEVYSFYNKKNICFKKFLKNFRSSNESWRRRDIKSKIVIYNQVRSSYHNVRNAKFYNQRDFGLSTEFNLMSIIILAIVPSGGKQSLIYLKSSQIFSVLSVDMTVEWINNRILKWPWSGWRMVRGGIGVVLKRVRGGLWVVQRFFWGDLKKDII